jgi:hypothetical protein
MVRITWPRLLHKDRVELLSTDSSIFTWRKSLAMLPAGSEIAFLISGSVMARK